MLDFCQINLLLSDRLPPHQSIQCKYFLPKGTFILNIHVFTYNPGKKNVAHIAAELTRPLIRLIHFHLAVYLFFFYLIFRVADFFRRSISGCWPVTMVVNQPIAPERYMPHIFSPLQLNRPIFIGTNLVSPTSTRGAQYQNVCYQFSRWFNNDNKIHLRLQLDRCLPCTSRGVHTVRICA